ncbi:MULTISPECIES: hypothetical protein [Paenibacillus]|uniref:hypothetical protein n=1 Tax=Paenibacillus TaxID=44249 RepID=UPI0022B86F0F|nr:hypothetical protein [Paenibacillus caseinilyticus]MCZ8522762.1 hypothetical protein [Paenibacillus caseinilyticus]
MNMVFVEYKVEEVHRTSYLAWAGRLQEANPRVEIYEGDGQPNLFVELWRGLGAEEFAAMKAARTDGDNIPEHPAEWNRLTEWVAGGASKIHIWLFQKVK